MFRNRFPSRFRSKLCVVCSAGGHLAEALMAIQYADIELDKEACFLTKEDAHVAERLRGRKVYYIEDPHTSLSGYIKNAFQSLSIFIRERPKLILTTGAGIALATCILGWLYGSKIIYVESGARVTTLSRTGKLIYHFADIFYVQWEPLLQQYPKAVYKGRLL